MSTHRPTETTEVGEDDFADVLAQITDFVRTRVQPRETEIMETDAVPPDLRAQAAEMGLFGYATGASHPRRPSSTAPRWPARPPT